MIDIANSEFLLFLHCAHKSGLRYMCIGGYAVNYYGFHRHTQDLDIWIAPTEINKQAFLHTLLCMGYSENETNGLLAEDFTQHFKCSLGTAPDLIDILTVIHQDISFDEAESQMEIFKIDEQTQLNIVGYDFLREAKTRSDRFKDWNDIDKLEQIRNSI